MAFALRQRFRFNRMPAYATHHTLRHGVHVRKGTSDPDVFKQIFVDREYACLDDLENVDLILDCGANVGYSSAYFLSCFPDARVVAVEPDSGNVEALARNLAPYGGRAQIVQAGVWSHDTPLAMSEEAYRGGGEWARQVRPCRPGEKSDLRGVSVETLLAQSGADRISILKVDIEGAEAVVFADGYEAWIDRVDVITIELHDDSSFGNATQVFNDAIRGQGFNISHSGELTVCRR